MFTKNKLTSDSISETVKGVLESSPVKIPTPTGTRVLGTSYGNSAKAHKDQTKSAVDTLKGPKDKEMKEELKGNQDKIDANHNDKIDAQDFKILRNKKVKSEGYDFVSRLFDHAVFAEEVEMEINEVLSKDATAGDWIHDFIHSDNPKFAGKTKAERKKMALGAYYAKQNEEKDCSCEDEEGHDDEKEDKALVKKLVKKSALKNEEVELDEARETTTDDSPNRVTTDTLKGREEGGKSNEFKSFKLKLKTDGEMKAPAAANAEDTTARKSIEAKEGLGDKVDRLSKVYEDVKKSDVPAFLRKLRGDKPLTVADVKAPKKDSISAPENLAKAKNEERDWDAHNKELLNVKAKVRGEIIGQKAAEKAKNQEKEKTQKEEIELDEKAGYSAKAARAGKDIGKPGKAFAKIAKSAGERYGSKERGEKVAGAILAKLRKEETVEEAKTLSPGQDDAPFEPPYSNVPKNVKDKSGAVHTPMSRARDLARQAMKRIKTEMLGKAPGNN